MAKEKPNESKTETIVGGSKAADFKPGGRAHPEGHQPAEPAVNKVENTEPAAQAPVTTDAAAHTPPTPSPLVENTPTGPASLGRKPTVPGDDNAPFNARRGEFARAALAEADAESDPVTVRDFLAQIRAFAEAGKARNWLQMMQVGAAIVNTFAGLFAQPQSWGVTQEDAQALSGADGVGLQLASMRQDIGADLATRAVVSLDGGGEPHPLSGSPVPMAAGNAANVKGIDPATLLVLAELVMKLWAAFRKRNAG